MIPDILWPVKAIEQENPTWPGVFKYIDSFRECELVTGYKIGLAVTYQVRSVDGAWSKAQVRGCYRSRFLRVVNEVALRIILCLLTDDLDRVFVGSYRAIRAEA